MSNVKIVTDSTLDISKEILEEYDITVIPLSITINETTFTDGVDLFPNEFIEMMRKTDELPKSSQPAVGKFLEVYESFAAAGYTVISIHMANSLSGTIQSAQAAAQMSQAEVTVIDSLFISKALGFQVIEAAKMAKNGLTREEIVQRVEEIKKNTNLYITVDTLENLVKGGRIGKGKALIGSLLNIKPIASLQNGVYTPIGKVRSHSQAVKFLVKQFAEDVKGKTVKSIGIAHADAIDFALKLKQSIQEISPDFAVDISYTTPVISTHTGPGAIGFMYFAE
ncbi:DegV domain-containing protein [Bacillus sp. SA1-12]|uniref:DegV family protein n=1 Tax=Bacillus sp. SA1-12 TaxID=1455638 RepID=UPI0006272F3E|nr:DegV family protein [Bacillus sp. SA1-12]KKI88689.1 DegV domain-containing protein [Bacillus sp. SA1-12]